MKVRSYKNSQQKGYTKFRCFLRERDNRDRKQIYIKKEYPMRNTSDPGVKNIQLEKCGCSKNVLLPPLHIKLNLMIQFVKAKKSECFKYICIEFQVYPKQN